MNFKVLIFEPHFYMVKFLQIKIFICLVLLVSLMNICHLLYGLPTASVMFKEHCNRVLIDMGFRATISDRGLYLKQLDTGEYVFFTSSKMLSHSYFQISKRTELYFWPLHLQNYMPLFISYIVYQQFLVTNRYSPISIWPNQTYLTNNYVTFISKMC
jgi:hypothetical protein